MTEKKSAKNKSLKKTLRVSYVFILGIMIVPTMYSILLSQVHTRQYDTIITNVGNANRINQIVKNDVPNELWEIVCGKNDFISANPYDEIQGVFSGIEEMQKRTKNNANKEKLEVAFRACTTLERNIEMLEMQINGGGTVEQNEKSLEEIRTITNLFSDIMQDFILSEIESANETNYSIKKMSITLSMLQLVIFFLALLISINGYHLFFKTIQNPIDDMQKLSAEISHGNLAARTKLPNIEELIPLADNMNEMARQIEVLINKNTEEQKNFQKAEMKALQAQITPHFLYNTLDTIIWLAEEERTEQVVNLTKAFSEFLRISLSRGHEWITIQHELEHIKNYLTIQKIRYADILNYEIDADEALLGYDIIKLVLQPLIENAIYHGIKNKRGRGHIKVKAAFTDEKQRKIKFEVTDDGAGFTVERLKQVKNEIEESEQSAESLTSVYGLYNVNKKLRLYYGEETTGLIIESEHGNGSKISFVIPAVKKYVEKI